ncbi:RNA methyltransferase [Hyphococcus sp. DH-69]|uniref:RNA methyltransferase n=1 Tax=Hyphococcus formosus TaxID=3143534 RepID=UPI00398AD8AE
MTDKTTDKPSATGRIPRRDGRGTLGAAPIFVLVEPQMGENIGACARAMLNFGLSGLRLVNPRDGWPNEKAGAMAAGATIVIDQTRVFDSTVDAIADCQYVIATTARPREVLLPVLTPTEAATALKKRIAGGEKCAVLFGGERSGLSTKDVMHADAIVSIPVNPAFASLNLGQAALLIAYEWAIADDNETFAAPEPEMIPAAKENFERFFAHLVKELDEARYFYPEDKRVNRQNKLKAAFQRAGLTEGEVRSLRGVIKALVTKRKQD